MKGNDGICILCLHTYIILPIVWDVDTKHDGGLKVGAIVSKSSRLILHVYSCIFIIDEVKRMNMYPRVVPILQVPLIA